MLTSKPRKTSLADNFPYLEGVSPPAPSRVPDPCSNPFAAMSLGRLISISMCLTTLTGLFVVEETEYISISIASDDLSSPNPNPATSLPSDSTAPNPLPCLSSTALSGRCWVGAIPDTFEFASPAAGSLSNVVTLCFRFGFREIINILCSVHVWNWPPFCRLDRAAAAATLSSSVIRFRSR